MYLDEIKEIEIIPNRNVIKRISHHPELTGRVHVASSGGKNQDGVFGLESYRDYAETSANHIWVAKAIRIIKDAVKQRKILVVDDDNEIVENHTLPALFEFVNDTDSMDYLWEQWVTYKLLGGEAFFEFVPNSKGFPVEIWARSPEEMIVVPDKSSDRAFYPRVAGYRLAVNDEILIPHDVIWHDKFFNPNNRWRGLSVIAAARMGIIIDVFTQSWTHQFLKRGARPDWAMIAPEGLTPTEKEELEELLIEKFGGPAGNQRPVILEQGVTDIKSLNWTPKDTEGLAQREMSREEIGAIFGVPDAIMGWGVEAYDNADRIDANTFAFWRFTAKPLLDARDNSLTNFFTKVQPILLPGQRIVTDLSSVSVLQNDNSEVIDVVKSLWGMGVPFEILNEQYRLGITEFDGWERSYIPTSVQIPGASVEPQAKITEPDPNQIAELVTQKLITHVQQRSLPAPRSKNTIIDEALFIPQISRLLKRNIQDLQLDTLASLREGEAPVSSLSPLDGYQTAVNSVLSANELDMPINAQDIVSRVVGGRIPTENISDVDQANQMFNTFKSNIRVEGFAKEIIRAAVSSAKQFELGDDTIDPLLSDFHNDFDQLVVRAVRGSVNRTTFESEADELVKGNSMESFVIGSEIDDALTTEERRAFDAEYAAVAGAIVLLSDDIFSKNRYGSGEDQTAAEGEQKARNRVVTWVAGVAAFYTFGQLWNRLNPFMVFTLGIAIEHCNDCLRLNGQIHRAWDWRRKGLHPRSRKLDCNGYNCNCNLTKDEDATAPIGDF